MTKPKLLRAMSNPCWYVSIILLTIVSHSMIMRNCSVYNVYNVFVQKCDNQKNILKKMDNCQGLTRLWIQMLRPRSVPGTDCCPHIGHAHRFGEPYVIHRQRPVAGGQRY